MKLVSKSNPMQDYLHVIVACAHSSNQTDTPTHQTLDQAGLAYLFNAGWVDFNCFGFGQGFDTNFSNESPKYFFQLENYSIFEH